MKRTLLILSTAAIGVMVVGLALRPTAAPIATPEAMPQSSPGAPSPPSGSPSRSLPAPQSSPSLPSDTTADAVAEAPAIPAEPPFPVRVPIHPTPHRARNVTVLNAAEMVDARYGEFFALLQQQARDSTRVRQMLIEREMIAGEIMAAARAQGIDTDSPSAARTLHPMIQAEMQKNIDAMKASLGEDYRLLLRWSANLPDRNAVSHLAAFMADASIPLSEAQRQGLLDVLQNIRASAKQFHTMPSPDPIEQIMRVIPDATIGAAAGFLSPSQLDLFRLYVRDQVKMTMEGPGLPAR